MANKIINRSDVRGTPVTMVDNGDGSWSEKVGGASIQMPSGSGSQANTGVLYEGIALWTGAGQAAPWQSAGGDGAGAGNLGAVAGYDFNGVPGTWDRHRNNVDVTLLVSAARTTAPADADITFYNLRALTVWLDITAFTAGSLTVTVQVKDPASGKYVTILTSAAIAAVSTTMLRLRVGLTPVANVDVNAYLTRVGRIHIQPADATSITYSVGYSAHP